MNHKTQKYTLPEDNVPKMAGEPVAAYAIPQEHTAMYYHVSKVHDENDVEAVAKKVCFTDEAYEYHKQYGFYKSEIPVQESYASEEKLVASLDVADAEGYITDEETNHIMNLWKVVD